MNDPIQVILISSIVVLTAIFLIVGIWLVLVLREIHKTIKTTNQTAAHLEAFLAKLNSPIDLLSGLKTIVSFINLLKKEKEKKKILSKTSS